MLLRASGKLALTLSVLSLILAAGCSSGNTPGAATDTGGTSIELWARGGTAGGDAWNAVLPQLQKDTGITIKFSQIQNFDQELQSRAQSKNLPDMWVNDDVLLGTYNRQGLIQPIVQGDYSESANIDSKLWDQTKALDGQNYAIPFSRQTMVTLIRSDWLKTLGLAEPKTLDEMNAVLDAFATKDPDGNGQADTYGMAVPGSTKNGYMARWAISYVWQQGGKFLTPRGDGKFDVTANSGDTKTAVSWIQKNYFCKPGRVQPGALTADTTASSPFFKDGKAGVELIGPYEFAGLDSSALKGKYSVITGPAGSAGATMLAEGENVYYSAGTTNLKAVKKVANWLISADGQKALMTNKVQPVVRVPVNKTLAAATVYNDPRWGIVQETLQKNSAVFPATTDVTALKQDISNSLNKIMASCGTDPAAELDVLQATLTQAMKDQGLG